MAGSLAFEALHLSQGGDVDGALALLRAARENGPLDEHALSLFFTLLSGRAVDDEVFAVCDAALAIVTRPLSKSTWHLRRGLRHLEAQNKAEAVADLSAVLKLRASDDHAADARRALLEAAQLKTRPVH